MRHVSVLDENEFRRVFPTGQTTTVHVSHETVGNVISKETIDLERFEYAPSRVRPTSRRSSRDINPTWYDVHPSKYVLKFLNYLGC